MSTATLLIVVGGVVCLKTLAFVALMLRRGRRQRVQLHAAAEAVLAAQAVEPVLGAQPADPAGWRLQWAEPGVMLVENTSGHVSARDVELSATLTASSGTAATVAQAMRFVGTGACFTARFAELERWLGEAASSAAAALGQDREPALPPRLHAHLLHGLAHARRRASPRVADRADRPAAARPPARPRLISQPQRPGGTGAVDSRRTRCVAISRCDVPWKLPLISWLSERTARRPISTRGWATVVRGGADRLAR